MTGRQEYDRTKDRQRILDKYMIDTVPTLTAASLLTDHIALSHAGLYMNYKSVLLQFVFFRSKLYI